MQARPKQKTVRRKTHVKHRAAAPKPKGSNAFGEIGVRRALEPKTDSIAYASLLIVTGLAMAIACFGMAVIPARRVPWRPAAIFVANRQVDLTLFGVGLLTATAFALFWTRA